VPPGSHQTSTCTLAPHGSSGAFVVEPLNVTAERLTPAILLAVCTTSSYADEAVHCAAAPELASNNAAIVQASVLNLCVICVSPERRGSKRTPDRPEVAKNSCGLPTIEATSAADKGEKTPIIGSGRLVRQLVANGTTLAIVVHANAAAGMPSATGRSAGETFGGNRQATAT
jgi:hypothetical protein